VPYVVHVASLKPAKVEAVREALAAIAAIDARFADASLRPVDVTDIAPRMPMTEAEIVAGARTRVQALSRRIPGAGTTFFVGLEGGVDRSSDGLFALKSWACVGDGAHLSFGGGGVVVLPAAIGAEVAAGAELGDVIDALAGAPVRGTRGAWGLLTRDLVTRRDAFRTAVISAFAPFYNAALFAPRPLTR
jgi:inosine/xanthosine triphosphatase